MFFLLCFAVLHQVVFRQLARWMGFSPVTLAAAAPPALKASFSSLPGGFPDTKLKASTQQTDNPFSIMTIPIAGAHPLQNFARFQTVNVVPTDTEGQYDFFTPQMNSLAINTGDAAWLASMTAASGYLAEGSDFKVSAECTVVAST